MCSSCSSLGYVSGYPTIALFPSGGTGRIDLYAARQHSASASHYVNAEPACKVGSRRPDDMIKWLHTNATDLQKTSEEHSSPKLVITCQGW